MPLVAVAVVPSAPLVLPEITGPEAHDLAALRDAVATAVAGLIAAAGMAPLDRVVVAARAEAGALAGMGARLPEGRAVVPDGAPGAGWAHELGRVLLSRAGFTGTVEDLVVSDESADESADDAADRLHDGADTVGLLVLADGSATRGPRAPAGDDPRGGEVDSEIAGAITSGDVPDVDPALARALQVRGLPGFAAAATAARRGGLTWQVLYTDAPAGVGYVVALAGVTTASLVVTTPSDARP